MISIDRIEVGIAVLEVGKNAFRRVPVSELPPDIKEGSVLREENGRYIHDIQAEKQRKAELLSLQKKIFKK